MTDKITTERLREIAADNEGVASWDEAVICARLALRLTEERDDAVTQAGIECEAKHALRAEVERLEENVLFRNDAQVKLLERIATLEAALRFIADNGHAVAEWCEIEDCARDALEASDPAPAPAPKCGTCNSTGRVIHKFDQIIGHFGGVRCKPVPEGYKGEMHPCPACIMLRDPDCDGGAK